MKNITDSRFIATDDPKSQQFVFQLPKEWETRPYEYEWAKNFADKNDIVLDAACGLGHPLKFYLGEKCKHTFACDIDERLLDNRAILLDMKETYTHDEIQEEHVQRLLNSVSMSCCSLTDLPYSNQLFDKIFCISVIEHLNIEDIYKSLVEFKRVLKEDGLIILTCDYPTIDLDIFNRIINEAELTFFENVSFTRPPNVLTSTIWGELNCFRAVLKKKNG
ncbi:MULTISPECIES: class I SAM-dependent methyltransferase [Cytobacillus]|uniref:Class I SAM-dependent methyltransferase n=1 Tax=Cytobacillus stercorigallinarum TaxID=2762240 RepID=A0ABR8QML4_9BACI|nr:class I SAM-dependent methyltransferase [Cytobacillus stercorigallinarum]MBD7936674.1 class I SAM-dependent methyltransferase [Cytobacillus stercorigallinarum]